MTTPTTTRWVGRPMARRLRVRGWLLLETPLHVGGLGGDPSVDLALALDGQSRLYIPGTSLAGALRASAGRTRSPGSVDDIWGYVEQNGSDRGSTSRIIVHDGLVTTGTDLDTPLDRSKVEARSGIGIDRVLGTVAHGILYGRAVIPRGAYVRLAIDVESAALPRDDDPATAMLGTLLLALGAGRVRLGAARTRGLGSVVLAGEPEIVEQRFDSLEGLLAALDLAPAPAAGRLAAGDLGGDEPGPDLMTITIGWRPRSPVMSRAGVEGFAVRAVPLVSGVGADEVALVLPGSSIKGALRSHAERIERTVRRLDAPSPLGARPGPERSRRFREQLEQLDAVRLLFGSVGVSADPADSHDKENAESGVGEKAPWGVGALFVDDCYATDPIPGELWRTLDGLGIEEFTPPVLDDRAARSWEQGRAELPPGVRDRLAAFGLDQADHVAIDRWTGGAADGRLFSTLEPHAATWRDLTLTVDLRRLNQFGDTGLAGAAVAVLLLVLRDLAAGRVRLGYGVNRGHGDIDVTGVAVTGFPGTAGTVTLQALLREPSVTGYEVAWRDYIDQPAPAPAGTGNEGQAE